MKRYFCHRPWQTAENNISQLCPVAWRRLDCPSVLCVLLSGRVQVDLRFFRKEELLSLRLTANVLSMEGVVVPGSEDRKSLRLDISDAEGCGYWEVCVRATEGGMLSCFNLCQCPSVQRWGEFRAQCVPLYLAVDPADRSCRRHSKASALH